MNRSASRSRTTRPPVPASTLQRLRAICLALPEAREEAAWVGTRWCIRKKNFAHVLMVDQGLPPAYASAAGTAGPACILTFRSPWPQADVHAFAQTPFFRPPWFPDIVGLRLDEHTDPDELQLLLRQSWRHMAPKGLRAAHADIG